MRRSGIEIALTFVCAFLDIMTVELIVLHHFKKDFWAFSYQVKTGEDFQNV